MRVAIDARELCGRPTGVGRYLSGLLDAWSRNDDARRHEWTLIAHQRPDHITWPLSVAVAAGNGGTTWEQFALPRAVRAARADVLFAPGYTAPLSVATPLVLTIHDVSYFAHPEWFSAREGTRRRLLTAWSARRARVVITDTQFSRAEIARHIGLSPSRLRVIPLGLSQPAPGPRVAADRDAMILYVGSIFERRRVDRLIASFDGVAARVPNATLEIIGENRTKRPRIDLDALRRRSAHADRITIRSYVDDETLAALYQRASVFAFLSEYEGFGLTPLEALAEGVPPVLLDTEVARETCGDAARYVNANASNDELAGVISDLLTNSQSRQQVLQHAISVLGRYRWDRAAAATLAVLEEAAVG
ncbi:MAG TPA: glycosyltransferase family 1 protein [Vicinamibacterales bacterium]